MTPRQAVALAFPCARAAETLAPQFRRIQRLDRGELVSSILSINK